jgi:hypothetical protein
VRTSDAAAPPWQCPARGVAYDKYAGYLERRAGAAELFRPRSAADPVPPVALDASLWALVAANALTLVVALWQSWDPRSLMLVYWAQSVVIGVSNVFRMLALDRFCTENFRINGRPVEATSATKRRVAAFFALHYGLFHAVYFAFLAIEGDGVAFDGWFALCTLLFAANHLYSHRYNVAVDRRGTPNIGTLMFTPYLRIVPMHLTIILGGMLGGGLGLLLFVTLKTVADAAMHLVEHGELRRQR